jgi:hypothetical protein
VKKKKKKKKNRKTEVDLSNLGFDEALARLIQTEPDQVADAVERINREEEEVREYVEERRSSIRKGARRTRHRFRL